MSNLPTEAQPLQFTFANAHPLSALIIDQEPWFVAKEVASFLGYNLASDMTRMLDDDETDMHLVHTRSENGVEQNREVTIISESGLYACILRSKRPEAKTFRRWVTREVLPNIRKQGSYGAVSMKQSERIATRKLIIALASQMGTAKNQFAQHVLQTQIQDLVREIGGTLPDFGLIGAKAQFALQEAQA